MDLNLWRNKEELKKFLDNLGIEYRYGCFEENNPQTCHLLADYLQAIDKAKIKAAQLYKSNCDDNNFGLSCDAYGRQAFKGTGLEKPDTKLAQQYFVKGCDLGEPRACYHGGQMFGITDKRINEIVTPDPEKAIQMLTKACLSQKQPAACTLVHSYLLRGFHGRPADTKKSAEFAALACDQNEYLGCFNLMRMYHLGEGVEADAQKSEYFRERARQIRAQVKKPTKPLNVTAEPDLKK